jgi:AcrR family transcriptional regulator
MPRLKLDRTALLSAMAEHVLVHGLGTTSLRPLARSAGTSDRMLIYHFGSKDALIADLLDHLAERMADGLDAALPQTRFDSVGSCVATVSGLMRQPGFAPYARVWLDIVAAAAQGGEGYLAAGGQVIDRFLGWIEARLPERAEDPAAAARLALALIEGALVLDAVGHRDASDAAIGAMARLGNRQDAT